MTWRLRVERIENSESGWRLGWPTLTEKDALVRSKIGPEGVRWTRTVGRLERARPFVAGLLLGLLAAGLIR